MQSNSNLNNMEIESIGKSVNLLLQLNFKKTRQSKGMLVNLKKTMIIN